MTGRGNGVDAFGSERLSQDQVMQWVKEAKKSTLRDSCLYTESCGGVAGCERATGKGDKGKEYACCLFGKAVLGERNYLRVINALRGQKFGGKRKTIQDSLDERSLNEKSSQSIRKVKPESFLLGNL